MTAERIYDINVISDMKIFYLIFRTLWRKQIKYTGNCQPSNGQIFNLCSTLFIIAPLQSAGVYFLQRLSYRTCDSLIENFNFTRHFLSHTFLSRFTLHIFDSRCLAIAFLKLSIRTIFSITRSVIAFYQPGHSRKDINSGIIECSHAIGPFSSICRSLSITLLFLLLISFDFN